MKQAHRYIQWNNSKLSDENKVIEIVDHFQARFELGSALLISNTPQQAYKVIVRQWKKLTRQLQQKRETMSSAEDILSITRTISRMQRVKFSLHSPSENPGANFYILSPAKLEIMPNNCFSLYLPSTPPNDSVIMALAPEGLVVAYTPPQTLKYMYDKSILEEHVQTVEASLIAWLEKHSITVELLKQDLEKANEALDLLLSSSRLQAEFLSKTKLLLHTIELASPLKLSPLQQSRLESLKQLEKHVRILSPAFLSDHIEDTQNNDSFLLRDLTTKSVLTLDALKEFISQQYRLGHQHLAAALEHRAGFIRL